NSHPQVIEQLKHITGREIQAISADICEKEELSEYLKDLQIDGIIHFAAYKAVGESVQHPLKYYRNNIGGMTAVLEWALENKVMNVVFSSSCTVYGEPQDQKEVNEQSPSGLASSPYGR